MHPGVRLAGTRLACFVLGRRRALLPAFGRFTGLALQAGAPGERRVATTGRQLFALPIGPDS